MGLREVDWRDLSLEHIGKPIRIQYLDDPEHWAMGLLEGVQSRFHRVEVSFTHRESVNVSEARFYVSE